MKCPNCGNDMLDIHPLEWEIGKICIQCGYKEVDMDWQFECQRCHEVFEFSEKLGCVCPKCGCPVVRLAILQSVLKKGVRNVSHTTNPPEPNGNLNGLES